ncbi:hypothetical protein DID80_00085 [Candidatus Marinamargulisbacteria bacterium SCGC AAA071-K20]|nr:hypothetical protein DID80_00085 [Candidatus Marinamargulisbacteria bacterium SCGC AAA071-K20]
MTITARDVNETMAHQKFTSPVRAEQNQARATRARYTLAADRRIHRYEVRAERARSSAGSPVQTGHFFDLISNGPPIGPYNNDAGEDFNYGGYADQDHFVPNQREENCLRASCNFFTQAGYSIVNSLGLVGDKEDIKQSVTKLAINSLHLGMSLLTLYYGSWQSRSLATIGIGVELTHAFFSFKSEELIPQSPGFSLTSGLILVGASLANRALPTPFSTLSTIGAIGLQVNNAYKNS